jgi:hypothetical protein
MVEPISALGVGAVEKILKNFIRIMEAFEFKKPGGLRVGPVELLNTGMQRVRQIVAASSKEGGIHQGTRERLRSLFSLRRHRLVEEKDEREYPSVGVSLKTVLVAAYAPHRDIQESVFRKATPDPRKGWMHVSAVQRIFFPESLPAESRKIKR